MTKEMKKLKTIASKIVAQYSPEKIILFGSYAWGKPTKDSDFDLLIVKKGKKNFLKEQQKIREIIDGEIAADILICSPQKLSERLKLGDFFFENIVKKGKYFYGKAEIKTSSRMVS